MTDQEPEVLDGEPVLETPEHEPAPPVTSTALAPRQRRSEVIRPLDADQLVESFHAYQQLLPRILDASDYQAAGTDKDGKPRKFVKKSGWRKIATAFDLDVQIIRSTIDRDEHGKPARAEVWARAVAPSGRSMDGDGYCSVEEERFGKAGEPEWKIAKARAKLENDLRATATTRAMNRAISGLVGMGEVSAEEIDGGGGGNEPSPPAEASDDLKKLVGQVVAYLVEFDEPAAAKAKAALAKQFPDGLPAVAGQAIVLIGSAVKEHLTSKAQDAPTEEKAA